MRWLISWVLPVLFHRAASQKNGFQNSSILMDPMTYIRQDDFSMSTYYSLGNESSEYKDFDIDKVQNETRRFLFGLFDLHHWGGYDEIIKSCFYLQTTYRNALTDLRRYYSRRVLYRNTLEYEIGYLTHEIIWRYQTILELFEFCEMRFLRYYWGDTVPISLMLYMYTNIMRHSVSIIHLCNMMHELERKYKVTLDFGVFDDYVLQKGKKPEGPTGTAPEVDAAQAAYDAYLATLRKEQKRKRKEEKQKRKKILQLDRVTTRGRPTKRKSRFPLHYGWSIENW